MPQRCSILVLYKWLLIDKLIDRLIFLLPLKTNTLFIHKIYWIFKNIEKLHYRNKNNTLKVVWHFCLSFVYSINRTLLTQEAVVTVNGFGLANHLEGLVTKTISSKSASVSTISQLLSCPPLKDCQMVALCDVDARGWAVVWLAWIPNYKIVFLLNGIY